MAPATGTTEVTGLGVVDPAGVRLMSSRWASLRPMDAPTVASRRFDADGAPDSPG
jgi:hypothetical protein